MAMEDTLRKLATEQTDENYAQVLNASANVIESLRRRAQHAEERNKKLECLESCGVDNWEGYDEAMRMFHEDDEESE